jgi:hypothetical protein
MSDAGAATGTIRWLAGCIAANDAAGCAASHAGGVAS